MFMSLVLCLSHKCEPGLSIRRKLMLMLMSRLSSLAHKLLMLMLMLMLASLVRTGLNIRELN